MDEQTAVAALQAEAQFNVIDFATGWKLDLIIFKSRPFSQTELSRRLVFDYLGTPLAITSAEDVLLAKLEWAKLGQSSRQIEDAAGILRVRPGQLDLQYILQWVRQLGLTSQWHAACRAAGLDPTAL